MNITEIRRAVKEMDPKLKPSDDTFKTAVMMIAALEVGPDLEKIAAFTKLPREFVTPRFNRLRHHGIFKGGEICANWLDVEEGGISFWMDVGVAEGYFKRVRN